jgi:hypothetical protein
VARDNIVSAFLERARGWMMAWLGGGTEVAPAVFVAPSVAPSPRASQLSPNAVFTPTRPRAGRRNLVGRQQELDRILDAILLDAGHVVLYSERGRGKTSLANMAVEALRRRGAIVGRFVCEAQTGFDTLFRGLARDLPNSLLASHGDEGEGCESVLPAQPLRPADVANISARLTCPRLVFVIDEFDRVQDGETRTRLADTIKLLSDRGVPLSLIIVGVSATLEQIIGQHPSIERNIMPIHLPLLTDGEIGDMLRKGGTQAGLTFSETAISIVTGVARGMPYMAQLMGLRMAQAASQRSDDQVHDGDVLKAAQILLRDTSPSVVSTYTSLVARDPDHAMRGALERIANAAQDSWGRMAVTMDGDTVRVGGKHVPGPVWRHLQKSGVLASPDGNPELVQFQERPLMYYVQLLAARDRLVAEAASDSGSGMGQVHELASRA